MGLEIINRLRKSKGMTSGELSRKSGVPLGTLNKILSGVTKDPKLETLRALAKVLECRLDDFDDFCNFGDANGGACDSSSGLTLEPDENDIIIRYRRLPETVKEDIRDYIEMKYAKNLTACSKQ